MNQQQKPYMEQTGGATNDADDVTDIDELELLSDIVMQFEQSAYDTKKRINKLDRLTYKSQLLPPTLRLCYQALQKSWMQDVKGSMAKSEFDEDKLDTSLANAIKQSGLCIKEFTKFKGDFFALNEPIVNKDICNLSYKFVTAQVEKQQAQMESLSQIEENVGTNDEQIEELKSKFETFQNDKFHQKLVFIQNEAEQIEDLVEQLDQKDESCTNIIKDAKNLLKTSRPQTKEQRSKHSDINSKLQKTERKYQKWNGNFKDQKSKKGDLKKQLDVCETIVDNLKELPIKTMVAQSKGMQKLVDCSLTFAKQKLKLQALLEDNEGILTEGMQLQESCIEFQKSLLDDLLAEYQELIERIGQHNQNLDNGILEISESLSSFEDRIGEMKISEQDHFFLNKEILRFRTAINGIDSQRVIYVTDTESIQEKFDSATDNLDSESAGAINLEDLDKLRENLKHLQKYDEIDLQKIKKGVDGLEQHAMRSLKNQLNADNKLSQGNISKVKKNYDEFLKMFEKMNQTYNDCVQKINQFNSKFDSQDLERRNHLQELQERLKEEEQSITGVKPASKEEDSQDAPNNENSPENDDQQEKKEPIKSDDCLQATKRQIIQSINGLVNSFNDITKVLRDSSGKSLKAEGPLNDLIAKNKQIQADCEDIQDIIDAAKKTSQEIQERLLDIINAQLLDELMQKYRNKENLIDECSKLKSNSEKQQAKIAQQLGKQIEMVEEQIKKLDMFNPINSPSGTSSSNQEFLDQISQKIDNANELLDNLQRIKDENERMSESIESACVPLTELGEREVQNFELETLLSSLKDINEELGQAESACGPKQAEITNLQKEVKKLIGQEIEGRLKESNSTLDVVDKNLTVSHDSHVEARKKLKSLRDMIQKTQKQQGQKDPQLLEKLDEMMLEANQLEDMIGELETKLNDQRRKKTDTKKQIDDMVKGMQGSHKFKPNQLEAVLSHLDELKDKNGWITEKLANLDNKMNTKLKDVDELVLNHDKKQEIQNQMSESLSEMDEDLTNLSELLEKLPKVVKQLKSSLSEMSASAGPGDDFCERKDKLAELLEELEEIESEVEKFDETYNGLKDERDKLKKQKDKTGDVQQLQKLLDLFLENKDQLSGLFTNALDIQEKLNKATNDIGDCDIPMLLTKRKSELTQYVNKGERLKKELANLKNTKKKSEAAGTNPDDKVAQMIKEQEFKLKVFDKDKADLTKAQTRELDPIQPMDYDDMGKASELLKKIRKFKNQVNEAEQKLKDLEDIQVDIVNKMTEQDLENSTDLLGLQAQGLRERLQKSKAQLQKIQSSGESMDGNTSNDDEENFVLTLKNEMPSALENIDTNLDLLQEIEKMVPEVKQSRSLEMMNDLREKVELATESVEESEKLVVKKDQEILEWNIQKKLCKRDCDFEEAKSILTQHIDDLLQEKQNTEIELNRNREKQEENRDQVRVDKDGNKVDIMKDLERLEQEMMNYLNELDQVIEQVQERDQQRDKLFEDFNKAIPAVIIDERQRRAEHLKSLKLAERQLKRPPMLKKLKTSKSETKNQDDEDGEAQNPHQMLKTNCTFRNPIKALLKDLQQFTQIRKDLEDKYAQMRREVFKIKQIKLYKPVQGDAVDEMFAGYLNKAKLNIEVQRISASNYMFGTKKILAKIINGRLVIRVGGGYMNVEEFIEQYGKIELQKMIAREQPGGYETGNANEQVSTPTLPQKNEQNPKQTPTRRTTLNPGANNMMNKLAEAMNQNLRDHIQNNAKLYDSQSNLSMKDKFKMRKTINNESQRNLISSMRSKGNLNASNNKGKLMTAEEKAKNKEAIGNLANALMNTKSNYKTTGANFDGSASARQISTNQESISNSQTLSSARAGSKSPSASNSAQASTSQTNSGTKQASSKLQGIRKSFGMGNYNSKK